VTPAAEGADLFAVDADPRWLLVADGWVPAREPGIEAALALVNGYLGTRAAVEEGSGVFDTATQAAAQATATPERQVIAAPTPELVVAPD